VFQDGPGGPPSFERRRRENATAREVHKPTAQAGPRRTSPPDGYLPHARKRHGRAKIARANSSLQTAGQSAGSPGLRRRSELRQWTRHRALGRHPAGRGVLLGEKCAPPPARETAPWAQNGHPEGAAPSCTRSAERRRGMDTESPLSTFRAPPVYPRTVSRTLELSLQSSFQLSLTVLVCYRSRGHI
jgi:hypothetical protein